MKIKLTLIIAGFLTLLIFTTGQGCAKKPAACTEEAKICKDGAVVVREGPDCEFQKCPEELSGSGCGLAPLDSRDKCCVQEMKDKPHIMCVGNWEYDEQRGECVFECTKY